MNPEPIGRSVTPLQTVLLGTGILTAGAVLTFTAHYQSTAKQLAEEGIPPAARLKALPLAARALGASTLMCAGFGAISLVAWNVLGLSSREVANVATFSDAVALAKQQRDLVRKEMRSSLFGDEGGADKT